MQKVEVSICIVSYNASRSLNSCLVSLLKFPPSCSYEIIVVDNSPDNEQILKVCKKFPRVRYIKSLRNIGYGGGNNLAIQNSTGKYALILNPDTQVFKQTIDVLYSQLQKNSKLAVLAPMLTSGRSRKVTQVGTNDLTPLRAIFALSFFNKLFPNNPISKAYYSLSEDTDKNKIVSAVPGSAYMMRISAFREVLGFDPRFFLYFEESDLGRRLKAKGWILRITPKAKVLHEWESSTNTVKKKKIQKIFNESRFYYFKKHFGILNAVAVEVFCRFGKYEAAILSITLLGGFLRFYRLPENIVFHGELGDNYLAMKNILTSGVIPLLGPPTSHPWLSFGPFFYWFFTPVLLFFQYSPIGMSLVFAFLHTVLIVISYIFTKSLFNKKTALVSSFLIAISPAYISFSHESRFFSLTLILFYPFYFFFLKKRYLISGLFFALMLNFHLTPLIYIPALFIYLYFQNKEKLKEASLRLFTGILIGFFPFIVYNIIHHFEMIKAIVLWIPYRVAGFIGLVPKNNVDTIVVSSNIGSAIGFIKHAFLPLQTSETITIPVILAITILTIVGLFAVKRKTKIYFLGLLLLSGYLAIFVHGNPPSHYYLPLYPILVLLVSIGISHLQLKRTYLVSISVILLAINSLFYFSNQWFYHQQNTYADDIAVPYTLQLEAAQAIIKDASGDTFSLSRVGRDDQFEQNYSQNYKYLLWKAGNEPKNNSYLIYTIYENRPVQNPEEIIFSKGGIVVTKKYEIDAINA